MNACLQPLALTGLRYRLLLLFLLVPALMPRVSSGQLLQRSLVVKGARILTMDGATIEAGTLVISGDRIRAVGTNAKLPMLATTLDVSGATITPGLIDVASALGRVEERASAGGNAARRAEDAFDRYDTVNLTEALSHGVTAVFVSPPGSSGIRGTGAVMRLARNQEQGEAIGAVLVSEAAVCIDLGSADKPVTRLKTLQGVQKAFQAAVEYRRSLETYEDELAEYVKQLESRAKKSAAGKEKGAEPKTERPNAAAAEGEQEKKEADQDAAAKPADAGELKKPRRPARSLAQELMLRALDGEIPVRVTADRSSDILNALELAKEFSLRLVLEGAAEAHLVAREIAEAKALVVLGRLDLTDVRRDDPLRRRADQPTCLLDAAEVPWVVGSGSENPLAGRFVLLNAQMAAADSSRHHPLELVTAEAAEALQVDSIGRLRPGSLADFVVWSGDPLDAAAHVLRVFVGGQEVYAADSTGATQ